MICQGKDLSKWNELRHKPFIITVPTLHLLRVSMVVPSPSRKERTWAPEISPASVSCSLLVRKTYPIDHDLHFKAGPKKAHTYPQMPTHQLILNRSCGRWKSRSLFISLAAYPAIMEDTPSFHHPFFETSPGWYIFKQRTFECGVPCLTLQPAVFPRVASIPPHCPTVNLHHALHFYYLFPSLFMTITSSPYQYIYIYPFSTCLLYIYMYIINYISIFYAKKVIKKLQPTSYPSTNIALCTFCSWMWSSPSCNFKGGKQVSAIYTTSINDFLGEIFQAKKGTPSS